ncbi:MAG TPA: heavy-metal-associated domain-containing protein [Hydrogenophaga sp.]|nr:heavy-metal-associated domain-containing protein [Hydrogenophaga sp.]
MNQTFNVQGMTCGHCEKAVTAAIKTLDPTAEVRIDRAASTVEVTSGQPPQAIAEAIREEGYTVTLETAVDRALSAGDTHEH